MSTLVFRERPAASAPEGLLILHHGRGADELDLLTLADVLDPMQRLHAVTPRAPLSMSGSPPAPSPGYHWYLVPRVGYPDPDSFQAARAALAELHDELWLRTGIAPERTVLGGFSMGAVMSYAMAFDAARPAPAGALALSGFIPTVEGWQPDLDERSGVRAFVAHGRQDRVIAVEFARAAVEQLRGGGVHVDYHESDAAHHIDPRELPAAAAWLRDTLAPRA